MSEARVGVRDVRLHNLGLIIRKLASEGAQSRAEIAASTGLNRSTVSSLIEELRAGGLLREGRSTQHGGRGRPSRPVELEPRGGVAIGIEISIDYYSVHALDLAGKIIYRSFVGQQNRQVGPVELLRQIISALVADEVVPTGTGAPRKVSVTIALPGLVNDAQTSLVVAPNLGWSDIEIVAIWNELAAALGIADAEVRVDKETNLGALAEMRVGVASGLRAFAYILGETGVGAALISDGRITRGANGFAGEFGHMRLGTGADAPSLESLAGQHQLLSRIGMAPTGRAVRSSAEWPGSVVAERIRQGDTSALETVTEIGTILGIGMANLANLVDVGAFVLDGFYLPLREWISEPIDRELQRVVVSHRWSPAPLLFSEMAGEAAVRGAALAALDGILDSITLTLD